jgi:hypothetical protein
MLIATPTATRGTTADGGANPEIQALDGWLLSQPDPRFCRFSRPSGMVGKLDFATGNQPDR